MKKNKAKYYFINEKCQKIKISEFTFNYFMNLIKEEIKNNPDKLTINIIM